MVGVRYTVETTGRVTGCSITRSSGNAVLDATTCRLIELRFRYRPWLDAAGRPVRSTVVHNQEWVNELGPRGRRLIPLPPCDAAGTMARHDHGPAPDRRAGKLRRPSPPTPA
ncbi:TonB family protein [Sphingomonas aerolata]|uniref:energy transducer TonB n=1 Tax=Sphingomonas aerolata TaxID=185951 RepID=UPI002FE2B234